MPLNTLSENPSCSPPWPSIHKGASNTPKLEVPPSCLITPLPLRETATPRPLTAAAALLQASDQLDETVSERFDVQHMAHSNSGPKLCAALLPRPQHTIAARTLATNPLDIVSEFLLGKNDMATIYLLPNPYFDAFEEVIDIRSFDICKHGTAGLCLTADDGDQVFLGGITPSTPAAKIPRWRTCIKGAWLIKIGPHVITSISNAQAAFRNLSSSGAHTVTLLFSHPEVRPDISQGGLPIMSSSAFHQQTHDQINNRWDFTSVADHLRCTPKYTLVDDGGVINCTTKVMKLTRRSLL